MAKQAQPYLQLQTNSVKKVLDFVSIPVIKSPVFYKDGNEYKRVEDREVILRKDENYPFEVLSGNYQIVKHEEAVDAAIKGLNQSGIPFEIQGASLDHNGAKMLLRIQLKKDYEILKEDVLRPEITLINTYDGSNSLTFDLGSFRLVCLNLASASISDLKARFLHFGNSADPNKLAGGAVLALDQFEKIIIPQYRKLADEEITKEQAVLMTYQAIESGALPQKLGTFVVHCVTDDKALEKEKQRSRTLWTFFNALTWAVTHKFDGTPTRVRQIRQEISKLFKDDGKKLVKDIASLNREEVDEWLLKIK